MTAQQTERVESIVQLAMLLLVGSLAGAASFTHVHDWTMHNSPAGTGDWFGWANAVISELTPTAAGLEIRRRKRHGQHIGYPMAVLIAAACLSIAAQLAVAEPSPTGWLLAAVPALAFLALSKLVLSRTTATDQPAAPDTAAAPTVHLTAEPAAIASPADPEPAAEPQAVPAELLTGARMADFTHRAAHDGHPITAPALAEHLAINEGLAAAVLAQLHGTPAEERP
ncbi:hypothetical protein [Actinomadura hibisca]|uniref:hypothetical protein n=1 Tax=Actinomadura hibisca TaxID=68565 RepID=UPI000ADFB947|nr:hypothetical protein [Actinomadura hibisca]